MKAVLAISSLSSGGAERALVELAAYLAKLQWHVLIATFEADPNAVDFYTVPQLVRRCRLDSPPPQAGPLGKTRANGRRVRALRQLLRAEKPDVVLSFMETTNVLCLLATFGLGVPAVVAERIDPAMHLASVPLPWRLMRRLLYRRAAAVTVQTEAAAVWLRHECKTTVHVVPNSLRALPRAVRPRDDLVLAVGRLDYQKGHDVLLRAFALVSQAFPQWRLAIAGDGPQREALRALADSLDIADQVDWIGVTKEVEVWYARASVVAMASRYEGFPNVLLEAMGMGAAVVATDCRSGPAEIIVPQKNGMLIPVDDVPALSDALRRLMSDAELRQRLGTAALNVRHTFDAERVHGQWRALLESAASPQPAATQI